MLSLYLRAVFVNIVEVWTLTTTVWRKHLVLTEARYTSIVFFHANVLCDLKKGDI